MAVARRVAGFVDAENVGRSDRRPDLLAVRIAGDRDERFGAAWLHANVVAAKFGIGLGVASRSRLQGGDTDVGKALSTRHETPFWLTVG